MRVATLAAVAMLAACSGRGTTTVIVDLSMAGGQTAPSVIQVSVYDRFRALALERSYPLPRLPGKLILEPPDVDQVLRIAVDDAVPPAIQGGARVKVRAFATVEVALQLGAPIDGDADGVPDAIDNCPAVANLGQADQNGDGLGDACDSATGLDAALPLDAGGGDGPAVILCTTARVTTIAGDGTPAFRDGPGAQAEFHSPAGIAFDRGTAALYLAELDGHRIRKVAGDAAFTTSTVAGNGVAGYQDYMAAGPPVQFFSPAGITLDPPANAATILVADSGNAVIRAVVLSPFDVYSLAGSNVPGYKDGMGMLVQFNGPTALAVDGTPFLYIADENNFRVRKMDLSNNVTTFLGDGANAFKDAPGVAAEMSRPLGVCFNGSNGLYLADAGNHRVRSVDLSGNISTLAGSSTAGAADGPNATATFGAPVACAVDAAGDILVADGNLIRRISPGSGRTETLAGTGQAAFSDGTTGCDAAFNGPRGLAVAPNRILYISDTANQRIRKLQY